MQTAVDPVMEAGVAGVFLTVTLLAVLLPQLFDAITETDPDKTLLVKSTVIACVPCPLVMEAPATLNDQLKVTPVRFGTEYATPLILQKPFAGPVNEPVVGGLFRLIKSTLRGPVPQVLTPATFKESETVKPLV